MYKLACIVWTRASYQWASLTCLQLCQWSPLWDKMWDLSLLKICKGSLEALRWKSHLENVLSKQNTVKSRQGRSPKKPWGKKSIFWKLDSTNFFNTLHKALLSHCYLDKKKRDGAIAQFSKQTNWSVLNLIFTNWLEGPQETNLKLLFCLEYYSAILDYFDYQNGPIFRFHLFYILF